MTPQPQNPMDLAGRRILVTGASSGIGRAVAVLLSRLGAAVICTGRNQQRLQETLGLLEGDGHESQPYDLAEVDGIPEWMDSFTSATGPLYGFVHSAGIRSVMPARSLRPKKWRTLFAVNFEAAIALAKGFVSRNVWAGENGSMVFVSSVLGQAGAPGEVAYSLSKGALDGMARSLAIELAPQRIRVNCVAPGSVRTPMYASMHRLQSEKQRARIEALHPLGIGEAEDVAHAVGFLLADTGRWITGTVLAVDGGYTAQ